MSPQAGGHPLAHKPKRRPSSKAADLNLRAKRLSSSCRPMSQEERELRLDRSVHFTTLNRPEVSLELKEMTSNFAGFSLDVALEACVCLKDGVKFAQMNHQKSSTFTCKLEGDVNKRLKEKSYNFVMTL